MSNVLEAVSKLKLKNSKNHFSNLVLYLPAYSYTGIWNYIRNNLYNKLRCTAMLNFPKLLFSTWYRFEWFCFLPPNFAAIW